MSEEKAICSNPECGNDDVSDNVKNYSLENYGVILCYLCQELVRSGKLDVEALKETLKKKGTLGEGKKEEGTKGTLDSFGGGAKESDDELEKYDREVGTELEAEAKELDEKDKTDEEKVIEAEVVGDGEESKWRRTVEIDEGTFAFHEEDGKLLCKSGDNVYELHVSVPDCTCQDFQVNKQKQKWCKHLKAASQLYRVKEFPKVPAEVEKALAKQEKEKGRRAKAKKEEVIALTVMGKDIEMVVQTPVEVI